MLGDVTLVAGDAGGGVTNWFFVKPESERQKKPAANTPQHGEGSQEADVYPLAGLAWGGHSRNRPLAAEPRPVGPRRAGVATMDYTTSQRQLLALDGISKVAFTPRGDGMVRASWAASSRSGEIEGSLFGLTSQSPSRSELVEPLGPRLVRGPERAGVLLAAAGRRGVRTQIEPRAAGLRHLEGHVLRHAPGGAAGLGRGGLREPLHHAAGPGLDQAGHRDDGRRALGGAGIPRRPLAGAVAERLAVGVLLEPGRRAAGVRDLSADLAMGPAIADGRRGRPRPRVPHHVAADRRGAGHGGPLLRARWSGAASAATSFAGCPQRWAWSMSSATAS